MSYCRTTNFGSDPRAAHCALRSKSIDRRVCISKNVCHQTLYAEGADGWHSAVLSAIRESKGRPIRRRALELIHKSMSSYLGRQSGKMIHDPLALAVALDESVCTLAEVDLYSQGPKDEQWGCWPCEGSNTWISTDYDEAKFRTTLLHDGFAKREVLSHAEKPQTTTLKDEKEEVVDKLSSTEREVLKPAKKIREITKLEERKAGGATLQSNQAEKINGKEQLTANFLDLVGLLPATSDVIAKVGDLIPARQQVTEDKDHAIAQDGPTIEQVTGRPCEVEVSVGVHGEALNGIDEANSTELQQDLVHAQVDNPTAEKTRRSRPRGGRSGFQRKSDAKHAS